ncbi:DMT family transporter [Lutibacter citreus]|uniref:DMT family transporter n=1 Tax=Lutibacter citreus TaxID=2138210 RepID=UPI000DBE8736|nr:DMT family transporter [Lutibacter citreus]
MEHKNLRWVFLFTLAIIWGSSFILMKYALVSLSPIQVGAIRILITAIFLLIIGFKKILTIKRRHWYYLALNGFIGTFFPVFLFAYAIDKIDSSIASILNSFTPLNTLIFGALFFGFGFKKRQLIGVFVGLIGTVMLILKGAEINPSHDYFYASFIIIATVGYAFNVNILKKYLHDLDALSITVGNFLLMLIPAFLVLWFTDFFITFKSTPENLEGIMYLTILAIIGTGLAKIMYNRLIQISTPIFSSSVTYIIPIVAITWGVFDGEKITLLQVLSGFVILLGVYIVNKAK